MTTLATPARTAGPPAAGPQHLDAALTAAYGAAAAIEPVHAAHVEIAGHVLRLEFADPRLVAQIMPAFEHVIVLDAGEPELTVHVWSSVAAGAASDPPVLEAPSAELPPGAFLHCARDRLHASYQPARGILNVLDDTTRRGWLWVRDGRLPYWERSAPLRHVIHWWMTRYDIQQLHSSAVGDREGAVLVVGRSGSGKSTTALACASSGLTYLGDDYVLVSTPPEPRVFSTFCSGKLTGEQVERFPHLAPAVTNAGSLAQEKALVYLTDVPQCAVATSLPLLAVLVPVIAGGQETSVQPLRRAAAMAALAPSTVVEVFTAGGDGLARMRRIVEAVPCFSLRLGRQLDLIGPAVRHLLDQLHGAPREPSGLSDRCCP